MADDLKDMQETLIRRHLGKRGIHALKVDEETRTVEIYVDESADLDRTISRVQKDAGSLQLRVQKSRRPRLA